MKLIDLSGKKFGRLTVLEKAPSKNKRTMWKCKCNNCLCKGKEKSFLFLYKSIYIYYNIC